MFSIESPPSGVAKLLGGALGEQWKRTQPFIGAQLSHPKAIVWRGRQPRYMFINAEVGVHLTNAQTVSDESCSYDIA